MLTITDYRFATYKKHVKDLLSLSLPMLLAQIAATGTGFVDTVMAGGASTSDLAAVALGNSLTITVYITLMGVMTAINPILSQKFGAKAGLEIGEIGRQGLWLGLILGLFGLVVLWSVIGLFQSQFNLDTTTLAIAGDYIWYVGLGMPAALLFRALSAYALSLARPNAISVISWLGFFLNIPLNYAFVYGKWGMPALGGAGCGVATAIVLWVSTLLLGVYIASSRYFATFGLMDTFSLPNKAMLWQFLRLGVPIGLSFFIEVSLFTCIMFLVAKLGSDSEKLVAAQQIAISITSIIYMIPQSIGAASTTQVGFYLGKKSPTKARYSAGVAISFAMAVSLFTALVLITGRWLLPSLYTDDKTVIGIVASLMIFAAAFQLIDAVQTVASYALRGYKLTKLPMLIHMIAFWGFGLLPGYYLAFYQDMGIYGFWWGLILSLTIAAVSLLWYLVVFSQKKINASRHALQ